MSTNKVLSITMRAIDQASGPARVLEQNILRLGPVNAKVLGAAREVAERYKNVINQSVLSTSKLVGVFSGATALRGVASFSRSLMSVQTVLTGLVASRAVQGLNSMVDRLDEIGERARVMRISPQTYSVLEYAAEKANQSVDVLAKGYLTAQANLANFAATGRGPAARAIRELGLSVTDSSGRVRSMAELLGNVDSSLKQIDGTRHMDILGKLFGRAGAGAWERIFAGGLQTSLGELKGLDAIVTPAQVAAAQRISDAVDRMKASWRGMYQDLTVSVEPAVTRMLDRMSKGLVDAKLNAIAITNAVSLMGEDSDRGRLAANLLGELKDRVVSTFTTSVVELAKLAAGGFMAVVRTEFMVLAPRLFDVAKESFVGIWNKIADDLKSGDWGKKLGVSRFAESGEAAMRTLQKNMSMLERVRAVAGKSFLLQGELSTDEAKLRMEDRNRANSVGEKMRDELASIGIKFTVSQYEELRKTIAAKRRELALEREASARELISDVEIALEPLTRQFAQSKEIINQQVDEVKTTLGKLRGSFGKADESSGAAMTDPFQTRLISINVSQYWDRIKSTFSDGVDFAQNVFSKMRETMRKRAQELADASLELRVKELQGQGTPESQRQLLELQQLKEKIALQRQFGQQYSILADQVDRVQAGERSRLVVNQELQRIQEAAAKAEELLTGNAQYRQALVTTGALDQLRADQLARTGTQTYLATLQTLGTQLETLKAKYPELGATVAAVMNDMSKSAANYRLQLAGPDGSDWMAGVRVEMAELRRRSGDWFSFAREGTQSVVQALTSDLAGALTSTKFAFDALGESLKQWAGNTLQMLARLATQMLLIRALSGLTGFFSPASTAASTATSGTVGRFGPSIFARGGIAGSALSQRMPGYAMGGIVMNGVDYGRDSVIARLAKREGIVNRDAMARIGPVGLAQLNAGNMPGGLGGGTVHNEIHIHVSPPAGMNTSDARRLGDQMGAAIVERLARNPALRSQMREQLGVR